MRAFYNDNDRHAAAWMRELMAAGLIPEGTIDGRSITEIHGKDVAGYSRCAWFAGICGWEAALRLAGWPDDRPVWSASCPCPPFSSAGKKKRCPECGGKPIPHPLKTGIFACVPCGHEWHADGRHLWPEMLRLIRECRPVTVFGEQVAGEDGLQWLDGVSATLEAEGYAVGSADYPAAGVGAPHIRQRLFWVAVLPGAQPAGLGNPHGTRPQGRGIDAGQHADKRTARQTGKSGRMGDADDGRKGEVGGVPQGPRTEPPRGVERMAHPEDADGRGQRGADHGGRRDAETGGSGAVGGMADSPQGRRRRRDEDGGGGGKGIREEGSRGRPADDSTPRRVADGGSVERQRWSDQQRSAESRPAVGDEEGVEPERSGTTDGMADARSGRLDIQRGDSRGEDGAGGTRRHEPIDGRNDDFWGDYTVIPCRDGKFRRVKRQLQCLVAGLPKGVVRSRDPGAPFDADNTSEARSMRLRGYGNAVCVQVAAKFIRAFLEAEKEMTP